jgi:hypothetical protein
VEFELHQRANAQLSINALLSTVDSIKQCEGCVTLGPHLKLEVAAVTDISPHTWVHRSQEERKM